MQIESKVSRAELRAAVGHLLEVAAPADAILTASGVARSSSGSGSL